MSSPPNRAIPLKHLETFVSGWLYSLRFGCAPEFFLTCFSGQSQKSREISLRFGCAQILSVMKQQWESSGLAAF
jgi:hypothetical protein